MLDIETIFKCVHLFGDVAHQKINYTVLLLNINKNDNYKLGSLLAGLTIQC